jgi:hypothetical protein
MVALIVGGVAALMLSFTHTFKWVPSSVLLLTYGLLTLAWSTRGRKSDRHAVVEPARSERSNASTVGDLSPKGGGMGNRHADHDRGLDPISSR